VTSHEHQNFVRFLATNAHEDCLSKIYKKLEGKRYIHRSWQAIRR